MPELAADEVGREDQALISATAARSGLGGLDQPVHGLQKADAGLPVKALCPRAGISVAKHYPSKSKYGGIVTRQVILIWRTFDHRAAIGGGAARLLRAVGRRLAREVMKAGRLWRGLPRYG